MHRNPKFHWTDRGAVLDFIRVTAFAHLFVQGRTGRWSPTRRSS
ncbi:hypothetical protein [Allosphingosinicella flava]|nr:hypothetical protein [Sphingosinicella flava]